MSGCLNVGHPGEANTSEYNNLEGRFETLQVNKIDNLAGPGGARGWDMLGIRRGVGLEWSVYRAMVMEDIQRVLWVVLFFGSMWLVHKHTIVPDIGKYRRLTKWDFGWRQYFSWYWGVLVAIFGGLWVRKQLIWWEKEVIREAR